MSEPARVAERRPAIRDLVRQRTTTWFCRQRDSIDCGAACLTMAARYHGRSLSLDHVRSLCTIDRQGASLLSLSRAAERIGFRVARVRATYDALAKHAPLPAIAHWDERHFVFIVGRAKGGLRIADPARGISIASEHEVRDHWTRGDPSHSATGFLLLLEPSGVSDATALESRFDESAPRGFGLLRQYIGQHSRTLIQVGIGAVVTAALRLALPFLTRALVDVGIAQRDLGIIWLLLVAQIVLIVSRTFVEFLQSWLLLHMGNRIDIRLVADYLRRLLSLPLPFFESRPPGDLFQRVEDHARVEQLLSGGTFIVFGAVTSLVVFSIALSMMSGIAFMILIAGAALQLMFVACFIRPRASLDYDRFTVMTIQRNLLLESIAGVADIKLFGADASQRAAWETGQIRLYRVKERSLRLEQLQQGGSVLLGEVTNAVITVMAAQQVIGGALSLGGLIAVQYLVGQVAAPLAALVNQVQNIQGARLSLERMAEVFGIAPETSATVRGYRPKEISSGDVVVESVSFGYQGNDGPTVLDAVDLTIQRGHVTAIVGSSGSGKTTLVKLLLALYQPDAGVIRAGGTDLRLLDRESWRARVGSVMQDGYLFSDTIARNIALGKDDIDMDRVMTVARHACIADTIELLPRAYDTIVGKNGIGLSQGQRQRVLIARALYDDPEFLFLDEATSALDATTERQIVANLETIFRHRTVVVIAHRLSTVRRADTIVVLERGSIVERGTHETLAATRGRYYELVRNQLELEGGPLTIC
jgi:ATP-binding cassette subfamily B protein